MIDPSESDDDLSDFWYKDKYGHARTPKAPPAQLKELPATCENGGVAVRACDFEDQPKEPSDRELNLMLQGTEVALVMSMLKASGYDTSCVHYECFKNFSYITFYRLCERHFQPQGEPIAEVVKDGNGFKTAVFINGFGHDVPDGTKLYASPPRSVATWQPIESAPKDNKHPLIIARLNDDGSIQNIDYDASWEKDCESWEMPAPYWYWKTAEGRVEEPSHWMYQPLPPAPK